VTFSPSPTVTLYSVEVCCRSRRVLSHDARTTARATRAPRTAAAKTGAYWLAAGDSVMAPPDGSWPRSAHGQACLRPTSLGQPPIQSRFIRIVVSCFCCFVTIIMMADENVRARGELPPGGPASPACVSQSVTSLTFPDRPPLSRSPSRSPSLGRVGAGPALRRALPT
jgi:hypothetical protein